jgi:hypothetical protein
MVWSMPMRKVHQRDRCTCRQPMLARPRSGHSQRWAVGTGLYLVSYTAFVAQNYEVYARVGLANIHSSPFSLVVNSSVVCASKSTATGYGLTASLLGVDATFTIQASAPQPSRRRHRHRRIFPRPTHPRYPRATHTPTGVRAHRPTEPVSTAPAS